MGSGRQDSNLRRLAPKASALAGLSYAPFTNQPVSGDKDTKVRLRVQLVTPQKTGTCEYGVGDVSHNLVIAEEPSSWIQSDPQFEGDTNRYLWQQDSPENRCRPIPRYGRLSKLSR